MIHKLQEFVPSFTLYLNAENAPNPAWKHFEKTNIYEHMMLSVNNAENIEPAIQIYTNGRVCSQMGEFIQYMSPKFCKISPHPSEQNAVIHIGHIIQKSSNCLY